MERKPVHTDWHRGYRHRCSSREGEVRFQVTVEETDLQVTARDTVTDGFAALISQCVSRLRGEIQGWCLVHPEFRHSLVPVELPAFGGNIPEIVRRMTDASRLAGVGPFAAVAGTIAQMVAEEMHGLSADLVVENGGDIFMYSTRDRVVGLLPDPASGIQLGIRVEATTCPVSFCASSATIGHSLSFGQGELVMVRAKDAALADALATALGNCVTQEQEVRSVVDIAKRLERHGVQGVFVQCGQAIGIWGDMELVPVA